jgi:transposase
MKMIQNILNGSCLYNCPSVIKIPPQSPDLNAIENLWAKLETEIRNHSISDKECLKKALMEEWERISPGYTKTR